MSAFARAPRALDDLLWLEGPLASRYRRALEAATGRASALQAFHVDRLGLSPEIAEELGADYLRRDTTARLVMVVSPDQAAALALSSESSWEIPLIDQVYTEAFALVAEVTKHEVLYGEIELGTAPIAKPDDLLLLEAAELSLDTPGSGVAQTLELKQRAERLGERDNLLDAGYVERMLELVARRGDVRSSPIEPLFPLRQGLRSFHTDLFGGVTLLRSTRPARTRRVTLVVLPPAQTGPELGPSVRFIALDDPELADCLHEHRVVHYEPKLAARRIKELEDAELTARGVDVTGLERSGRRDALRAVHAELPGCWEELRAVEKIGRHGQPATPRYIEALSEPARIKLSQARPQFRQAARVLAELDETDLDRLLATRPSRFLARLAAAEPAESRLLEARLAGARRAARTASS